MAETQQLVVPVGHVELQAGTRQMLPAGGPVPHSLQPGCSAQADDGQEGWAPVAQRACLRATTDDGVDQ